MPCPTFEGARQGYVFKTADFYKGLILETERRTGYFLDPGRACAGYLPHAVPAPEQAVGAGLLEVVGNDQRPPGGGPPPGPTLVVSKIEELGVVGPAPVGRRSSAAGAASRRPRR